METLADAIYMAAGGVPELSSDHAIRVAQVALELRKTMGEIRSTMDCGQELGIRIGKSKNCTASQITLFKYLVLKGDAFAFDPETSPT